MNNKVIEQQVKKILVHSKIHYLIQKIKAEEAETAQANQPEQKIEHDYHISDVKVQQQEHTNDPQARGNYEELAEREEGEYEESGGPIHQKSQKLEEHDPNRDND